MSVVTPAERRIAKQAVRGAARGAAAAVTAEALRTARKARRGGAAPGKGRQAAAQRHHDHTPTPSGRNRRQAGRGHLSPGAQRAIAFTVAGLGILGVAGAVVALARRSRRARPQVPGAAVTQGNGAQGDGANLPVERRSRSDPDALKGLMEGSASRVGFDLERLNHLKEATYKPLMEYLEYIQVQRGGSDTLVFVRGRDLDELAAMAGQSRDEFLRQSKKLGILLSMN